MAVAKNNYFDIDVKTSPATKSKIRVMTSPDYGVDYFKKKCDTKEAVKFDGLSPVKGRRQFFNVDLSRKKSCNYSCDCVIALIPTASTIKSA